MIVGQIQNTMNLCKEYPWEFNSWRAMKGRCYNPNNAKYGNYGAKGIRVHPELFTFAGFIKHLGRKPTRKHSVDRYPNKKGNYEPGNVRWATQRQQCRNMEKNKQYTAFGKTMCMVEWAEEAGMSVQTLSWRLHEEKQPIEVALRPVSKVKTYTAFGKTLTIRQWASRLGLTHGGVYSRIQRGWTKEKIFSP